MKHLKRVIVLLLATGLISCGAETDEKTTEEETTTTQEQMKVVQPAVDSAHEAASEAGDSSLLKDDETVK